MDNNLSSLVFYTKYSRLINGYKENYKDAVIRVMNGIKKFSKFKMDNEFYDKMTKSLYEKKWSPAGRIWYNMGTSKIEESSICLNNCGFISTKNDLSKSIELGTLLLMSGVGVGFDLRGKYNVKHELDYNHHEKYIIQDNKESWSHSIKRIIDNPFITFDYSKIRKKGLPISSGGTAAGPEELELLHGDIKKILLKRIECKISDLRCNADIINRIPLTILSSVGRRSAEILINDGYNEEFLNLKLDNSRNDIAYFSNNSVALNCKDDFVDIPKIIKNININGEPGLLNMINIKKFGRYGERMFESAIGVNPCGEMSLEHSELCNLASTVPINCKNFDEWYDACRYATFCALVVSTIPTNIKEIDDIIRKNHRIGISITGYPELCDKYDKSTIIHHLQKGYEIIRKFGEEKMKNIRENPPIKYTTIKPEGTISLMMECSSGIHYPISKYYIRRVRYSKSDPICKLLENSGIPSEDNKLSSSGKIFSFKVSNKVKKTLRDLTLYDQLADVMLFQRFWSDNNVSYTAYFKKDEEKKLGDIITNIIPFIKSISLAPYNEDFKYEQAPITPISKKKYDSIVEKKINWKNYFKDSEDTKYCTNDKCSL